MFWEQASINGSRTWTGTLIYLKVCDVKVWCLTKLRFNSVKKKKFYKYSNVGILWRAFFIGFVMRFGNQVKQSRIYTI